LPSGEEEVKTCGIAACAEYGIAVLAGLVNSALKIPH
jgi:hypothetical protein